MSDERGLVTGDMRIYTSEAGAELTRLAQLDSRMPPAGRYLVAEVEGEPRAAVPLDGGPALADPFRRTVGLVRSLEIQVAEMRPAPPRRAPRLLAALRFRRRRSGMAPSCAGLGG